MKDKFTLEESEKMCEYCCNFDNFDNPDGYADITYLSALSDSSRIVRKAEEEIKRQKAEIDSLRTELKRVCAEKVLEERENK